MTALPELKFSDAPVAYADAVAFMEARVAAILDGTAGECVWFLERPPLYTAGTGAQAHELLDPDRLPVHASGRGGGYTYHGPGQRVVYLMLDLRERGRDLRGFVRQIETWLIATLDGFGLEAAGDAQQIGIWIPRPELGAGRADKIAAIGLRVRRWVSFHGIAFNVEPDLEHFSGIVPCGIADQGITSLAALGRPVSMHDADLALIAAFEEVFGRLNRPNRHGKSQTSS